MQEEIKDILLELTRMVYQEEGLKRIVDYISGVFRAPCNIMDLSYRLIVSSDKQWGLENNIFFANETKKGYVSTVKELEKLRKHGTFKKENRPVALKISETDMTAWVYPLSINGVEIAYLSFIYIPGVINEALLGYMPDVCGILGLELQKDSFYKYNKGAVFSNDLQELLLGRLQEPSLLENRWCQLGYELLGNKYVIYVDIHDKARYFSQSYMIARRLQEEFRNSIFLIKDGAIIMLMTCSDQTVPSWSQLEQLNSYLHTDGLYAGMSSMFWDISQMAAFLRQARSAFALGRRFSQKKNLLFYDEYRVMDLVSQLADIVDIKRYCYPPLMRLIEYDRKNNTEMTKTLYNYLKNMKDTEYVLELMHIHRNTFFYRMRKIREIFGSSLCDAHEIMQIELTFDILKYTGDLTDCFKMLSKDF